MYPAPKLRPENASYVERSNLPASAGSSLNSPLTIGDEKPYAAEDLSVNTISRRLSTTKPARTDLPNKVAPHYAATVVKSDPRGEAQGFTNCASAGCDTFHAPNSKTPAVHFPKTSAMMASDTSQQRYISECAYVRVDWGLPQQDIIGISPSTTIANLRKRVSRYQHLHKQLKAKVVAAMIVQNVQAPDFRIVWDDDLGQSGLGELQALMRCRKADRQARIEMKAEWEERPE